MGTSFSFTETLNPFYRCRLQWRIQEGARVLILTPNWGPKGQKNFSMRPLPRLPSYLKVWIRLWVISKENKHWHQKKKLITTQTNRLGPGMRKGAQCCPLDKSLPSIQCVVLILSLWLHMDASMRREMFDKARTFHKNISTQKCSYKRLVVRLSLCMFPQCCIALTSIQSSMKRSINKTITSPRKIKAIFAVIYKHKETGPS